MRLGLPDSASNSLSLKLKKMTDEGIPRRIGERRASRYLDLGSHEKRVPQSATAHGGARAVVTTPAVIRAAA